MCILQEIYQTFRRLKESENVYFEEDLSNF